MGSSLALYQIFCACYFCFVRLFSANSFNDPKWSPFIFFLFCKRMDVKKISKCPLLQFSALWDFSNRIIFVLKIGFLRPSMLYPIFVFLRPPFFLCDFSNLFSSKPPQFLLETKRLRAQITVQGFRHYATCRRPSSKKFSKIFFLNFLFFKGLRLRKMGFLLFPVGEEFFSRFMGIPFGFFGVKLMKF